MTDAKPPSILDVIDRLGEAYNLIGLLVRRDDEEVAVGALIARERIEDVFAMLEAMRKAA